MYARELSRTLGWMGIKVDIFTRCHPGQEEEIVELAPHVRLVHLEGGPPEAPLDGLYPYLPSFCEELVRFAQEEGREYQLVHSHYWLSGWVGQRVTGKWGVPHVVSFHTLAEAKIRAKAGEKESPFRSVVEKELMASADRVIASSCHEKEAMVCLYECPRQRIEVVPCGVDLSLFRPLDIGEVRKTLGLNGEKVIVYVGRLEPLKGLELLFQSTSIMENREALKVLIIGGIARAGEVDRLKNLSVELGIDKITEFVGVVDHRLLPLYYNAADVCVVPSYYESFGLVALEALACGTPVVASRVGGLPTVVQHGRTGYLLSWRCPEPFADSLEMILFSQGLRRSMSVAARKRAERVGWETVAEKAHRIYASLWGDCKE